MGKAPSTRPPQVTMVLVLQHLNHYPVPTTHFQRFTEDLGNCGMLRDNAFNTSLDRSRVYDCPNLQNTIWLTWYNIVLVLIKLPGGPSLHWQWLVSWKHIKAVHLSSTICMYHSTYKVKHIFTCTYVMWHYTETLIAGESYNVWLYFFIVSL